MEKVTFDTQCTQVLKHMKYFGGITSLEAINKYGITRLSARIADLKDSGITIYDEWITVTNRYGKKCRVKEYRVVNHA